MPVRRPTFDRPVTRRRLLKGSSFAALGAALVDPLFAETPANGLGAFPIRPRPIAAIACVMEDGRIELRIAGSAQTRRVELRCPNLTGDRRATIGSAGWASIHAPADPHASWAIVVVPDGRIEARVGLSGTFKPLAAIA